MAKENLTNEEFFRSLLGETDASKILGQMNNWPVAPQIGHGDMTIFDHGTASEVDVSNPVLDGLFWTGQRTGFAVSEILLDSDAKAKSDYEWKIQQGLVEFRARVFPHPPKSNQRLMEISFDRNETFDLTMNDLVVLSEAIIPGLLFPQASRPLDHRQLLSSTFAFGKRSENDKQTSTFKLDSKERRKQLRQALDSGKFQSIEMSTTYKNSGIIPYRVKLNRNKSLFDRSYFILRVPLGYQWNEDIAQFLLDNQRETVGNVGLKPSPQGLAETFNVLTSAVLEVQGQSK